MKLNAKAKEVLKALLRQSHAFSRSWSLPAAAPEEADRRMPPGFEGKPGGAAASSPGATSEARHAAGAGTASQGGTSPPVGTPSATAPPPPVAAPPLPGYPVTFVDLIIFHTLHLSLPAAEATRSYARLREEFVDWNEVRISSLKEIQEVLEGNGLSLDLAVFIKDFLEFVHRQNQDVSLEFLALQNLTEIRKYLKPVRGINASTVDLLLHLRKEHPVFPLSERTEEVLDRLGLTRKQDTRDRREKLLHESMDSREVVPLHHFLLQHALTTCTEDPAQVACSRCELRTCCAFYARAGSKYKKNSPRAPRTTSEKAPSPQGPKAGRGGASKGRAKAAKGRESTKVLKK